ncbi:hypothetical protein [Lysobacter sp.]|uniref:hypothetical protein n=1 Tax=Lysobacter sp. TaxID=72226 RepID=UPI002D262B57|nr:hypothetical protein [Lysobacter sp.]HZX79213.1 hypothetical protein [Lysobacter sp.]
MDWNALGYGVAFFAGYALMTIAATAIASAGMYRSGGVAIQVMGYLVPVVAAFAAARKATRRRIVHGIAGGAIGVVPIVLLPTLVLPDYSPSGMLVIFIGYAVLAALGAVFGNHVGRKIVG